jgi:succinate dehydrogenase/fumarate reductase cytochrome b subunit
MTTVRLATFLGIISSPVIAFAAGAVNTYSELVNKLVSIMGIGVFILVTLGFVGYFYGISTNILQFSSESGVEKRKALFFWGIIILFVMLSVGGILRLLGNTLFTRQGATGQLQITPEHLRA